MSAKSLQRGEWEVNHGQSADKAAFLWFRKPHEETAFLSLHAGASKDDFELAQAKIKVIGKAGDISCLEDRARFADADNSDLEGGEGLHAVDRT